MRMWPMTLCNIGALVAAATGVSIAAVEPLADRYSYDEPVRRCRGKRKLRRHGAKLRTNRLHTSKRVRRAHRRAA